MKSKSFKYVLVLLCVQTLGLQLEAQNRYYPSKTSWQSKTPTSVGLNDEKVKAAVSFAMSNEYKGSRDLRIATLESFAREPYHELVGPTKKRGGPAGVIIRNGFIVAQWGDLDRVDMTFSVTKSFLSTTAGLAYDQKLIPNIQDSVAQYVWDGTFEGSHNAGITWHHLLTQSSDWSGELFGMPDWADRPPRDGGIDDWKNRKLNQPGTVFEYNDVRVNLLAYSLLQVWRRPLPVILKENIMDPIGASTTWRWYGYENSWIDLDGMKIQSVSGGGHSGGGVFISTTDMARFGYLFCRNGNWNGKQLISENWIKLLRQSSTANPAYGYMWWLNRGDQKWEGVPESVYYASGFGGNFIIVDSEHDIVVVTRWLDPAKVGELTKMIVESVVK